MKARYRVVHQRKTFVQALFKGRTYTDWYIAQQRGWLGWRDLGVFECVEEAEAACELHAGGRLLKGGTRIISEFSTLEK